MRSYSPLIGAAIAAMLVLPANAADSGWVNGSWQTYNARALKLDDVVGTVKVDVKDSGPMVIQISGQAERVKRAHVSLKGDTLVVDNEQVGTVWDWKHWFDFSHMGKVKSDQLQIKVAVPRGTPVSVDEISGTITIGNTMGPLQLSITGHTNSQVGDVSAASLDIAGSGRVTIGNVAGKLDVDSAGSGNVRVASAGYVKADIAGSGSVAVGDIRGGLDVDIAGSGDFSAASVHGPASSSIAGSGSVTIAAGEADPFKVEIMGSGNVSFGGVAVNPHIETLGSGSVKIRSYRGSLHNEGNAKLNIGG